jgi:hypothetical protein
MRLTAYYVEKFLYTRWKVSVHHFPNSQTFARKHSIINVLRSAFQNRPRIPEQFLFIFTNFKNTKYCIKNSPLMPGNPTHPNTNLLR